MQSHNKNAINSFVAVKFPLVNSQGTEKQVPSPPPQYPLSLKAHQCVVFLEMSPIIAEHLDQGTLSHCWITCITTGGKNLFALIRLYYFNLI